MNDRWFLWRERADGERVRLRRDDEAAVSRRAGRDSSG